MNYKLPGIAFALLVTAAAVAAVNPSPPPLASYPAYQPITFDYAAPSAIYPAGGSSGSDWDGNANGTNQGENPWLSVRFDVLCNPPGTSPPSFWIPGFFVGDTSATTDGVGRYWRARFTPPDIQGSWDFDFYFRQGTEVNVDDTRPTGASDYSTTLIVSAPSGTAPGFQSKGFILPYWTTGSKGAKYYTHSNGDLFLRTGLDSPENFLGYDGFQDMTNPTKTLVDAKNGPNHGAGTQGFLHDYSLPSPYVDMTTYWNAGNPEWTTTGTGGASNEGHGIIGALNYMESVGVNSQYALLMNLGGDGRDVSPFWDNPFEASHATNGDTPIISGDDDSRLNYAPRRLDQWEMVFDHAEEMGIMMIFVLAEQEPPNYNWFDGPSPDYLIDTVAKRLYYKNMIAMFGHHLGIKWIFSEETRYWPNIVNNSNAQDRTDLLDIQQAAEWIAYWDVCDYDSVQSEWIGHAFAIHGYPNEVATGAEFDGLEIYVDVHENVVDGDWWLTGTSLQLHGNETNAGSSTWRNIYSDHIEAMIDAAGTNDSAGGGSSARFVPVECDEQGTPGTGVTSYKWTGAPVSSTSTDRRKRILFDVLLSGGAGIEWYCGYHSEGSPRFGGDLKMEDPTSRGPILASSAALREYLTDTIHPSYPLTDFAAEDSVVSGGKVTNEFGAAEVFANPTKCYLIYYPDLVTSGSSNFGSITVEHPASPGAKATMRIYNGESMTYATTIILGTGSGSNTWNPSTTVLADGKDYLCEITFSDG